MKTINDVYDSIGQIWIEVEAFHYGDGVSVTRAERMTHIDRAYNHAGDALDGLEVLRGKLTPRAFEEVDDAVSAARKALRTVAMKTRPMNLDLNDEFFNEVERFAQAFILKHNEQLRSVCDRLYRHTEGVVAPESSLPPVSESVEVPTITRKELTVITKEAIGPSAPNTATTRITRAIKNGDLKEVSKNVFLADKGREWAQKQDRKRWYDRS